MGPNTSVDGAGEIEITATHGHPDSQSEPLADTEPDSFANANANAYPFSNADADFVTYAHQRPNLCAAVRWRRAASDADPQFHCQSHS